MRILVFSDLHCDAQAAKSLVSQSNGVDLVLGAGDYANCRHGIEICMEVLGQIVAPTILVAGNAESTEELRAASAKFWPTAQVLHGNSTFVADTPVFGLGGAVPVTPFGDWSYDFTEDEAAGMLATLPSGAILVAHSPPKGCVDVDSRGRSLGSLAIRNAVLAKAPKLVVCGHIHASAGKQENLGRSLVVNAGPKGQCVDLS